MEIHNPNVAAEMVEILKDYQSRYVPCFTKENKKEVVATVPVHGDQLFEERARNVEWAMRDGESNYDRLKGVPPEHADWHAKVTLYKVCLVGTHQYSGYFGILIELFPIN